MPLETINNLYQGDKFKRQPGSNKTYSKQHYCKLSKSYKCVNIDLSDDAIYLRVNTAVYV